MVSRSRELRVDELRLKTGPITPHVAHLSMRDSVCPVLFSLAVTHSISVGFFSCRYLDASVPCVGVPLGTYWKSYSETLGSKAACA